MPFNCFTSIEAKHEQDVRVPSSRNMSVIRPSFRAEPLYVVLPYFNYCKYQNRIKLFLQFIKRIYSTCRIEIVIVEGSNPKTNKFDLPDLSDKIFLHIRVALKDTIWIKENLINIAIRKLPSDWNYVAWIDADLTFTNETWAIDTIQSLKTNDVVQMFTSACYMDQNCDIIKYDKGFVYQYLESGKEYNTKYKYGFWHPGFAWACTRKAYNQMGALVDYAILGSGDRHMALAFIQKVEYSHPMSIHLNYQQKLYDFQKRCSGLKINYIKGSVLHHYHGTIANRQYQDRWNILTNNQYNPFKDIEYLENGLIKLTEVGKRLEPFIMKYFLRRKEDE